MVGFISFLFAQLTFRPKPLPENIRLDGQVALVTGANGGIGLEAAKQLAAHGIARIIVGVRDLNKGEQAKATILKIRPLCDVLVWKIDLESFESIAQFGERARDLPRLDFVLLNAGLKNLEFTASPTGHEAQVQVNHLGTALLSLYLLEPLRRTSKLTSKPSRMAATSSSVIWFAPSEVLNASEILERLDKKDSFGSGQDRYCLSKALNMQWIQELALKVNSSEIVINGVNPGLVSSQLHRADPSTARSSKFIAYTPAQGAMFLLNALLLHPESHGRFLSEQKP